MTIEQTAWFRSEVNNMVKIGESLKITANAAERAREYMERLERFRGREAAKKAAAKANQRLRCKVYALAG